MKLSEKAKEWVITIGIVLGVMLVFAVGGIWIIRADNIKDSELRVCSFEEDGKTYYIYLDEISEYQNYVHLGSVIVYPNDSLTKDEYQLLLAEERTKRYEEAKTTKLYHFTLKEGILLDHVDSETIMKRKDDTFNPTNDARINFIANISIRANEKIFREAEAKKKELERLREVEALQCD